MAQIRRAIRWTAALTLVLFVLRLAPVGAEGVSARAQDRKLVPVGREAGGRRVALVIGNDAYQDAPLRNAGNDARAVAAELAALPEPFTVTSLFNATQAQLATAIARFTDSLRKQDVAFVFYAGHGVQFGSDNYLVPVDYTGQSQAEARLRMIPLSVLHEGVQAAGVGIIVLDACRNNPFKGTRAAGGGLGAMEARGTLIAYATGAGHTANDNPQGGNGLFTRELIAALKEPGLTVYDVFRRVRERVRTATNGAQAPAVYEDLIGEVVLRSGNAPSPAATGRSTLDSGVIGRFRLGMTASEVNTLLPRPFGDVSWEKLQPAEEPDVRYFWLPLALFPIDAFGVPALEPWKPCWSKEQSYVVFGFGPPGLLRVSLRLQPDCAERVAMLRRAAQALRVTAFDDRGLVAFQDNLGRVTIAGCVAQHVATFEIFVSGSGQPCGDWMRRSPDPAEPAQTRAPWRGPSW